MSVTVTCNCLLKKLFLLLLLLLLAEVHGDTKQSKDFTRPSVLDGCHFKVLWMPLQFLWRIKQKVC